MYLIVFVIIITPAIVGVIVEVLMHLYFVKLHFIVLGNKFKSLEHNFRFF